MIQSQFKMSDKAFYFSRFSGVIPCEIIETGPKKVRILIEQYNISLWVSASRLMLQSDWPAGLDQKSLRWNNRYKRFLSAIYLHLPTFQDLNND